MLRCCLHMVLQVRLPSVVSGKDSGVIAVGQGGQSAQCPRCFSNFADLQEKERQGKWYMEKKRRERRRIVKGEGVEI